MPKLRSTYDGRLIYKTSYEGRKVFLGTIHLQSCKIVWDSVHKLACDIHNRNFSTFKVTIVSRSYDELTIILRWIVRYFVNRAPELEGALDTVWPLTRWRQWGAVCAARTRSARSWSTPVGGGLRPASARHRRPASSAVDRIWRHWTRGGPRDRASGLAPAHRQWRHRA